jgi:Uma2 family endonuclease
VSATTKKRLISFDEFCVLVKEDQKADLINGVIHMASPENIEANDLFVWLLRLIADYVDEKDLGKVNGSRVAYRLSEHDSPEPDIAFVRKERLEIVQRTFVEGPPDLAIEIVCPESVERDYEKKRKQYQEAGVLEYWIVDEILQKVTLLRLDLKGRYREIRPRKSILRSEALPGFWLCPDWLWQSPLPKKGMVLAQLLSG